MIGKHNTGGFEVPDVALNSPSTLWPTAEPDESVYDRIIRFMKDAHGFDEVFPYNWEITPGSSAWHADVVCRKDGLEYYYDLDTADGRSVYITTKPAFKKNDYSLGNGF